MGAGEDDEKGGRRRPAYNKGRRRIKRARGGSSKRRHTRVREAQRGERERDCALEHMVRRWPRVSSRVRERESRMQPEQRGQGWQAWPQGGADTGTGWAEARGSGTVRYHVSHSCAWLAGLTGWGRVDWGEGGRVGCGQSASSIGRRW